MQGAGDAGTGSQPTPHVGYHAFVKRLLDVAGATAAIVLLSPLLAWTAVALLATQGPPVLFRQKRAGLDGREFTLVKFRTMRSPRREEVWFKTDAQRLTRLGRVLRDTSIDELPELWNVLRGEMSLVGPRPLIVQYVDRYTPEERRRLAVRPGLTGWAVVNGRHTTGFEERLQLDTWYVDNWSLMLDLWILARTIAQVLRRQDVATVQDHGEIAFPQRFREALIDGTGDAEGMSAD